MGPVVDAIPIYHNRNTKVLTPTIPATIQTPIYPMATKPTTIGMHINPSAMTPIAIRMHISPSAMMPITIRMHISPSAMMPTTKEKLTTPSTMVPVSMGTLALGKALMVAHNPATHHMGISTGILSSTTRMQAHTRYPRDNTRSNIVAATKTLIGAVVAAVRTTYHQPVTAYQATMTIFGHQRWLKL
ncbi:hypothetical protein V493_05916 [Pseudogymnoascus sp. VKM F-4281 (FW-2241)]|nr:hypothetical protein V493_05916 [Pseudogymnoascus sp. VKM F-4281 (FW-2241)]